jgi:competence ComEA-like helix-hairpin-helix protein
MNPSLKNLALALLLALAAPAAFAGTASGDVEDAREEGSPKKVIKVVNLNTATEEELCTLPGIGEKKAKAIMALRTKQPFLRVTQLLQVKGFGPKTLTRLKPYLTVGALPPTRPVPPGPSPT